MIDGNGVKVVVRRGVAVGIWSCAIGWVGVRVGRGVTDAVEVAVGDGGNSVAVGVSVGVLVWVRVAVTLGALVAVGEGVMVTVGLGELVAV